MSGSLVTLRNRVFDTLENKRVAGDFIFNNFEVIKTYLPFVSLEDLAENNGRLYIIGLAFDYDAPATRTTAGTRNEIPIQVAFQKVVTDPQNIEEMDKLVDLVEGFYEACRKDVVDEDDDKVPYQWLRNEALKDENETPFAYMGLRKDNVFEAYFSAVYLHLLT